MKIEAMKKYLTDAGASRGLSIWSPLITLKDTTYDLEFYLGIYIKVAFSSSLIDMDNFRQDVETYLNEIVKEVKKIADKAHRD